MLLILLLLLLLSPPSPRLNFKEPEGVRLLTCTLLKEDFGLTIAIPLERLIPTVPLHLNYIHWVEDLTGGQGQPRKGIDIGGPPITIDITVKNKVISNCYVCQLWHP